MTDIDRVRRRPPKLPRKRPCARACHAVRGVGYAFANFRYEKFSRDEALRAPIFIQLSCATSCGTSRNGLSPLLRSILPLRTSDRPPRRCSMTIVATTRNRRAVDATAGDDLRRGRAPVETHQVTCRFQVAAATQSGAFCFQVGSGARPSYGFRCSETFLRPFKFRAAVGSCDTPESKFVPARRNKDKAPICTA